MTTADEERVRRIEDLVRALDNIPDPESRKTAHALTEAILALHGAGIERMMDIVFEAGESGQIAIRRFASDPLVASLLVLHGLHPDDLETRAQHALTKAQLSAELVGVFEGIVRVRLVGSGCGLKESVKAVLKDAVPDAVEIIISESGPAAGFVPLAALGLPVSRTA